VNITFPKETRAVFGSYAAAVVAYLNQSNPLPGGRSWTVTTGGYDSSNRTYTVSISGMAAGGKTEIEALDFALSALNPSEFVDYYNAIDAQARQREADNAKATLERLQREQQIAKETADALALARLQEEERQAREEEAARQAQIAEQQRLDEEAKRRAIMQGEVRISPVITEPQPILVPQAPEIPFPQPSYPAKAFDDMPIETGGVQPVDIEPEPRPLAMEAASGQVPDTIQPASSTALFGLAVIAFLVGLVFFWKR
jgi:hypothetical protein